MSVEAGSWKVLFAVALVGCAERLETLKETELNDLEHEFRNPSAWSHLQLYTDARKREFRQGVVERLEEVLGREIVSDVLFFNVAILDHNVSQLPTPSTTPASRSPQVGSPLSSETEKPVDSESDRFGRMTRDSDLTYTFDNNGDRTEITYSGGGGALRARLQAEGSR